MGNICRSTMAEGVFQSLTSEAPYKSLVSKVDSCGTSTDLLTVPFGGKALLTRF
jgi:low molecular weight phosphotyrosine protein phosphatase